MFDIQIESEELRLRYKQVAHKMPPKKRIEICKLMILSLAADKQDKSLSLYYRARRRIAEYETHNLMFVDINSISPHQTSQKT